jgi:glyoxylase-like metal-dependent hydrolase (beta-lactamase superfamily II)
MSGCEVWISSGGARRVEEYKNELLHDDRHRRMVLRKAGASDSEINYVTKFYRRANRFAERVNSSYHLKGGEEFELALTSFTATEVPGHTPWCILIHDVDKIIGFTGDFLLENIASKPLVQWADAASKDYKTLKSYIASLKNVKKMNLKAVFPGHGKVILNPAKIIDDLLSSIEARKMEILRILKEDSRTPVQIVHELFPDLAREGLFRGVCDVMAHIDMLEEDCLIEKIDAIPSHFLVRLR